MAPPKPPSKRGPGGAAQGDNAELPTGWPPNGQVVAPAKAPVRTTVATGSVGARNGRPGAGVLPVSQQQALAKQAMEALLRIAPPTDADDLDRWTHYV